VSFGNLKNAAAYFALRAKTARKPEIKKRFQQMATFYGRIANILPKFPQGYKQPENKYSSRLQDRVEECRAMAACCDDETCRRRLLELAEEYKRAGDQLSETAREAWRQPVLRRRGPARLND
jgi:hypothetical protein